MSVKGQITARKIMACGIVVNPEELPVAEDNGLAALMAEEKLSSNLHHA